MDTPPTRMPKHLVLDSFLAPELHERLLQHALSSEEHFEPTQIHVSTDVVTKVAARRSWEMREWAGSLKDDVRRCFAARQDEISKALAIPDFKATGFDMQLAAHRDGGFYKPHMDTHTGAERTTVSKDRILSLVYYFYRQPRAFTGGDLLLYPFSPEPPLAIKPEDNRLVAFPAFALHEVRPVACPGDAWRDARFSVNCWFKRARPD